VPPSPEEQLLSHLTAQCGFGFHAAQAVKWLVLGVKKNGDLDDLDRAAGFLAEVRERAGETGSGAPPARLALADYRFAAVWRRRLTGLAGGFGGKLECDEAMSLADFYDLMGDGDSAFRIRQQHAAKCSSDDAHFPYGQDEQRAPSEGPAANPPAGSLGLPDEGSRDAEG